MRKINKRDEPDELIWYRAQQNASYDDMDKNVKVSLKNALLKEQGYTCCYCMQRISYSNMKVEHLLCQDDNEDKALDYKNMFASCKGNEGQSYKKQYCDSHKGNNPLNINLLSENLNTLVKYKNNGEVISDDIVVNDSLNRVLNLNYDRLKKNRKYALDGLIQIMASKNKDTWKANEISKKISMYESFDDEGKYREYYGMFIYYLNKKLSKL